MTEATVRKLREEAKGGGEVVVVPAIGMSVVTNLGGDRQATVQCHVPFEAGEEVQNDVLDRMFRVIDRQKARYRLPELEEELEKHARTLARYEDDLAALERKYAAEKIEREHQIAGHIQDAEDIKTGAYETFTKSGRRGEFALTGHALQSYKSALGATEKLKGEGDKAAAERTVAIENLATSRERYKEEIARLEGEIAVAKAKIGGA